MPIRSAIGAGLGALALAGVVFTGCKSQIPASRVKETGGTAATWTMSALVDPLGNLMVTAKGTGQDQNDSFFTGLTLQVANSLDGTVAAATLADRRYVALGGGSVSQSFNGYGGLSGNSVTGEAGGALFHVLANNRVGGFCYINGGKLDGTYYAVACKTEGAGGIVSADEQKRHDLIASCQRLATLRIDGGSTSDFYARFDQARNTYACTCLNGKVRDLDYQDYYGTAKTTFDFENDCEKRVDGTTPTLPSATDGVGGPQ